MNKDINKLFSKTELKLEVDEVIKYKMEIIWNNIAYANKTIKS